MNAAAKTQQVHGSAVSPPDLITPPWQPESTLEYARVALGEGNDETDADECDYG